MTKHLPARPNLDHLRGQAKLLLAQLRNGNAGAARAFRDHLPAARGKPDAAKLKLADAQSVVARQSGFASWAELSRHVELLRALEGEWHFARLEIDGAGVPPSAIDGARILIDGDRFRNESAEATYEGVFTIDAEQQPAHIDIEFIAGPEAGNACHGIFALDGEALTMCLGLVGASRPKTFATRAGSGHALEHLQRASKARPKDVTGGTPPPPAAPVVADRGDPADFEVAMTPTLRRLQGEWAAIELVTDGKAMPAQWLAHGSRTMTGNELVVVFGGQKMIHAKVRIDERSRPAAIDYLGLSGRSKDALTYGIMEWIGDDVRFLMAPPGAPRPAAFDDAPAQGTLSRWRRR